MSKKLAKIKYLPNNFKIIEEGDYVICAVSGKFINLSDLNYWNQFVSKVNLIQATKIFLTKNMMKF